ncbi:MAG: hypothetical protein WC238_06300 [Parcubacteria group bacterium]|jgi:hypothetical protein
MIDKKILIEVWKTLSYVDVIGSFLLLPSIILLWYLGYTLGFWILLVLTIITKLGVGYRIIKIEKQLQI